MLGISTNAKITKNKGWIIIPVKIINELSTSAIFVMTHYVLLAQFCLFIEIACTLDYLQLFVRFPLTLGESRSFLAFQSSPLISESPDTDIT